MFEGSPNHRKYSLIFDSEMAKDYYNRGSIDTNAVGDLLDELEILQSMLDDKC